MTAQVPAGFCPVKKMLEINGMFGGRHFKKRDLSMGRMP